MDDAFLSTYTVVIPQSSRTSTRPTQSNIIYSQQPGPDLLDLPERLNEVPGWIQTPLRRFLRLKQRNWPSKTIRIYTQQYFNCLHKLIEFFIQEYEWSDWEQLSLRWLDDYIDTRLREKRAAATINWALINFRGFCYFLIDEGYHVPPSMLRMKLLKIPHRLPRPLSQDHIYRLERCIQAVTHNAKTEYQRQLAIRDLICFYLLWHCGLRISEVCSLLVNDVDLSGRKLFIRDSKERKDRVVYLSKTTVEALRHHLDIRPDPDSAYLFTTRSGHLKRGGLWKRLRNYGRQCSVPITAQRLRHTFASQMLAAGMPVSSLQRYLGHELMDTTMIYAEVSNPMLQQDYYRGITTLDPQSANLAYSSFQLEQLCQLIDELKIDDLEPLRQKEILEQMQGLLDNTE
jgi:site-specific recombinase XerD